MSDENEVTVSYEDDEGNPIEYSVNFEEDRNAKIGKLLLLMDELAD